MSIHCLSKRRVWSGRILAGTDHCIAPLSLVASASTPSPVLGGVGSWSRRLLLQPPGSFCRNEYNCSDLWWVTAGRLSPRPIPRR